MNDWQNRISSFIGAEVGIVVGDERIVARVRSVTVHIGRGATYELVGVHKGWQIQATATDIDLQDDGYRATGEVMITLQSTDANKG